MDKIEWTNSTGKIPGQLSEGGCYVLTTVYYTSLLTILRSIINSYSGVLNTAVGW